MGRGDGVDRTRVHCRDCLEPLDDRESLPHKCTALAESQGSVLKLEGVKLVHKFLESYLAAHTESLQIVPTSTSRNFS